ncbi:carboxypeptidase-like regulatory domain-containing protein [Hymenobacter sp. DH14]|uniref:Carboxypeptidase-like regulatory domain-containing protein n=1 Tax=Hymenobacter cyanobacteriorum TaxID=2926463 RepID=A0A9X2AIG0_9BACT|nr:carboxypeptidase-like regulatory domain-containing protein [Hymenobacter cyanobacteriorum]MCI1188590.1 carboxypeptidase-like regulatory domain-containing protein [Hymenobacter cyanobacteriorum]
MTYYSIIRLLGTVGLSLLSKWANGQASALTGTVVNAASGQPVPFAVVEIPTRHLGVQATELGTFVLELPMALASTDSLWATSLGYHARHFAVPAASPCRLQLQASTVALPEAVVRPPGPPTVLGPGADGDKFGFAQGTLRAVGSQGWQIARRFDNAPTGVVQAVRFYVKPNTQCGKAAVRAPFRVRLYAADGPGGAPGTDLLTVSVLTAAAGKGWHEVDLLRYQIQTPTAGFYVAMEWLYTDDAFGCTYTSYNPTTKEKKTAYAYGQSLGGYFDLAPPATWYLSTGYPWQQFAHRSIARIPDQGQNRNAAIQAVIQLN